MSERTTLQAQENRAERMVEAAAEYHAAQQGTARDAIGQRGSAYVEEIDFQPVEELPVAYAERYTRRYDYLPEDPAEITAELADDRRETHGSETMPSVLREDAFIAFRLRKNGVRFTVYEPVWKCDLDELAAYCNADGIADLAERGVPVIRRGDIYCIDTDADHRGSYLFPNRLSGTAMYGFLPFFLGALALFGGFILGVGVVSVMESAVGLLAGVAAFLFLPLLVGYGWMYSMFALAAVGTRLSTGDWWPSTPYARNWDGARDYLRR